MKFTVFENNKNDDIEFGLAANVSESQESTTNYNGMENSSSHGTNCCVKSVIWIIIMIILFPLPFYDLFFGYTDDTCVSEHAGRLAINLKDYLLVCGWIDISIFCLFIILLYFIDINSASDGSFVCVIIFLTIILILLNIFISIWDIFGAIIFWGLLDTTNCSNTIYNHVFASLIFKLVLTGFKLGCYISK